ncbi:hypothetical protein GCM10011577_28350 [Pseudarthrobacter polychromogenes]|uniref:Uncharacterized protein n=1 Tax=Pseudarthrobacter polychromogenes TaxID=1676 RepID=A0ABQ1XTA2_9MICC|nr:hypothetical protein GCM10011577_28350 [Pseudarthrobacter polychromogenes]
MAGRLRQVGTVADTPYCASAIALPVVGLGRRAEPPEAVCRGGGNAGDQTAGAPRSHQLSVCVSHGQESPVQPKHLAAADRTAKLRIRGTGSQHIPPQRYSTS